MGKVLEAYTEKFGPQMVERMVPNMKKVGKEHGINFSYGGYVGNTFDSHRFIWQSRETGGSAMQDKMVEALFAAYFEEEKSMGDPRCSGRAPRRRVCHPRSPRNYSTIRGSGRPRSRMSDGTTARNGTAPGCPSSSSTAGFR